MSKPYFVNPAHSRPEPADYPIVAKTPAMEKRYRPDRTVPIGLFVEDYINGRVDIKGGDKEFRAFIHHRKKYLNHKFVWRNYRWAFGFLLIDTIRHSKAQDIRIGKAHYDRGNDFFRAFLGDRMVYTSGFFHSLDETVDQAQDNKMDMVCRKLQLKEGEQFLDIGCGWGSLAIYAAKNYGVYSTGVTISKEGVDYGRARAQELGVADRVEFVEKDYRDTPRKGYDKIASLEMAEHVGLKNFLKFQKLVYSLLREDNPNGIYYLQLAGLKQGVFQESMVWGLFMNEYIFPGADASTPLNWYIKNLEKARFELRTVENLGIHYSHTLEAWYQNWESNKEAMLSKYGEWWYRLWRIFLPWSAEIAAQGNAAAYGMLSAKNRLDTDRNRFIGGYTMGERNLDKEVTPLPEFAMA